MYIVNTLVVLKLTGTGRIQIPLFSKGNSHCGCSFESLPSEIPTHFYGTDYDLGVEGFLGKVVWYPECLFLGDSRNFSIWFGSGALDFQSGWLLLWSRSIKAV